MIYKNFKEEKLSLLGFGTMRLPLNAEGKIDEAQVEEMIDYAMKNGVNYFDTAYPYHDGRSEIAIGKALAKYPRESFRLVTKFPGHQFMKKYDCEGIFEEQLSKCGTDYFDFYLYHNVCELNIVAYLDEKYGIFEFLKKCN